MAATKDISSYVLVLRDLGEEGEPGYALQLAPLQGRRARPTSPSPVSGGRRPTPPSSSSGGPKTLSDMLDGVPHGDTGGGSGTLPTSTSPASNGPPSVAVTVADVSHSGMGGGSGDDDIEEVDDTAAAAERNPGQIRTFLQNRCHIITQKEEVLIPIFYAPKKSKDDVWDRRQVKYVVALLGPLGFIFAATPYLPPFVLLVFAAAWGAGSVGFPMGLYGSRKHEQCFGRHMARLVLMSFSLLVLYMMYLSMIPVSTSVPSLPSPSSTDLAPSSPSGHQGPALFWIISYAVIGIAVMVGHIISWITGCHTGRDQDEDDSESTEKGLDTSALLQRFRDSL